MPDPVTHAVNVLNDVLERDPEAITRLINLRVDCNDRLAAHPHHSGRRLRGHL